MYTSRSNLRSRFRIAVGILVIIVIVVAGGLRGIYLRQKLEEYETRKQVLETQIEVEKRRTDTIDQYGKYVQTDEYIEEMARDKLGLVRDDEIIFRSETPEE